MVERSTWGGLAGWFEERKREGGEVFVTLREGAPELVQEFALDAHGTDLLPDDWRWRWVHQLVEGLASGEVDEGEPGGWVDAQVDVYTSELLAWLSSNLERVAYVDVARAEYGHRDTIVEEITQGQALELSELFGRTIRSRPRLRGGVMSTLTHTSLTDDQEAKVRAYMKHRLNLDPAIDELRWYEDDDGNLFGLDDADDWNFGLQLVTDGEIIVVDGDDLDELRAKREDQ